jgi:hypothetical protein
LRHCARDARGHAARFLPTVGQTLTVSCRSAPFLLCRCSSSLRCQADSVDQGNSRADRQGESTVFKCSGVDKKKKQNKRKHSHDDAISHAGHAFNVAQQASAVGASIDVAESGVFHCSVVVVVDFFAIIVFLFIIIIIIIIFFFFIIIIIIIIIFFFFFIIFIF